MKKTHDLSSKNQQDSEAYLEKKSFYDALLTIYGRNAVMEALEDTTIEIYKLHLSTSNQESSQLIQMVALANQRHIPIVYHDKTALSRISKNAKQDQGVALDIVMNHFSDLDTFITTHTHYRVIALDGIHNPQNLGMIIRSCVAGNIDAILLSTKGAAQISPLVIKASAGTLFKIPIIRSNNLTQTLQRLSKNSATLYTLSSYATQNYKAIEYSNKTVFVLGNESEGVSNEIAKICDKQIVIPMQRGVESLNVAVTASLLAFM